MSASSLKKPEVEKRVEELLGRMTLEEKIGQMNQTMLLGEGQHEPIRQGAVGSMIYASSAWAGKDLPAPARAELANQIQREAVDGSRLGIPLLLARDVIHGHRTVFPIPLGQAAAWDPALAEQAAQVAAREATAEGIKWTFTPMLDIARDPRWGRIAEGFGEDPYLGSRLAEAAVRGYQGDDFSAEDRLAACVKHFAGYGAAEGGRDYDRGDFSIATLRDLYLPPFQAAVKAGVATLMSGFHDFAGVPVAASRFLLTDILREEWGFNGLVVSDWNAVLELTQHGVAEDENEAALKALNAGVDIDMVSGVFLRTLAGLASQGLVSPQAIDEAARRILRVKFLAGLFERPYVDPQRAGRVMLTADHRALARRYAQEVIVLLKNDHKLLPYQPQSLKKIAVLGPLANAQAELFGSWTLDGQGKDVTSIAQAIKEGAPGTCEVILPSGYVDQDLYRARQADLAVVVVGEHPQRSGEASSISTLTLPPGQRQLVEAVYDLGVPVVLVVVAGRPLAIGHEAALAKSVLYAWQPGVEGGPALADLLFGQVSPSGKLPVSFPRRTGQIPVYYNRRSSGRPAGTGQNTVGYIDLPIAPLYPFGFGLSYTQFDYRQLTVQPGSWKAGGGEISAEVTNTGETAGTEIVQLYVRDRVGSVTRPLRELKGFERVSLQPGETRSVHFRLSPDDLSFTRFDGSWGWEAGKFDVWVGPDSARGLQGEFEVG